MNKAISNLLESVKGFQRSEHTHFVIDLSDLQWFFLQENDILKAGSKGNYLITSKKLEERRMRT